MRIIGVLLVVVILSSCGSNSNSTVVQSKPNYQVALDFINSYKEFCDSRDPGKDIFAWINENQLVTDNFKQLHKNLIEKAVELDPELGLGFDPIFDAQDYPDEGFEILTSDDNTGYLTVRGKDWVEFNLSMKLIKSEDRWLVDGCGVINIPETKRAER